MAISEQLRKALMRAEKRGETRYKIAQESRVNYTILARFLDGERTIKLPTADRLADYLGLELRAKQGRRK